jgi:sporulation protein YlmC with PRC-barrel domain|tara:strand:+ start:45 stop:224 length:180 start_codon:yes stop_codon:yes gene_type:complete
MLKIQRRDVVVEDGEVNTRLTELVLAIKETKIKGVHISTNRALAIAKQIQPIIQKYYEA